MDHAVFISHSSRDRPLAERICDRLERDGVKCWISSRDVPPGADFQGCIVEAIDATQLVLLVFSSQANHSNEIAKELSLASKKLLIPARIEDVLPEGAFRFQLTNRQFFDLFEDFDRRLDDLSKTVQAALAGTPLPQVAPSPAAPQPRPAKRHGSLTPVAIGALLALAGGAWWWLQKPSATNAGAAIAPPGGAYVTPPDVPPAHDPATATAATGFALPPEQPPPAPAFDAPAGPPVFPQPSVFPAPDAQAPSVAQAPAIETLPTAGEATPSFDCAKASVHAERAICANPALARLDRQLAAVYTEARTRSGNRVALQREQNAWRRDVRDPCMDDACIAAAHEQRIRQLSP